MKVLQESLLELIRRASAEIPEDVHKAIVDSLEREKKGTIAESAMKIIEQNIAIEPRPHVRGQRLPAVPARPRRPEWRIPPDST